MNQTAVTGKEVRTISDLLASRADLVKKYLGEQEFGTVSGGLFDDDNSFDIDPPLESDKAIDEFWEKTLARFGESKKDSNLVPRFTINERIDTVRDDIFSNSIVGGIILLMVGSYRIDIFNNSGVIEAARSLFERMRPEDFLFIAACGEEVMVEEIVNPSTAEKKYENRFLNLLLDKKYSNMVFPIRLPERPEFHCCASMTMLRENAGALKKLVSVGFDTHHNERSSVDKRPRYSSKNNEANVLLSMRAFFRYIKDRVPSGYSQHVVTRSLRDYKLYVPDFFYIYRCVPKFVYKRLDAALLSSLESRETH